MTGVRLITMERHSGQICVTCSMQRIQETLQQATLVANAWCHADQQPVLTWGSLAGVMADSTKTIVQMSTSLAGTSVLRSSHVMSATKACMRPQLYSGCAFTSLTAEAAKSQA